MLQRLILDDLKREPAPALVIVDSQGEMLRKVRVFGALAAELTSRQNTTFAFVTRLMLAIPNATIYTLREQFEDGAQSIEASPFADHIRRLDQTSQAYFENQFFTKTCSRTRPATAAAILPLRAISGC